MLRKSFIINVIKGTVIAIIITVFLSLIQAAAATYFLIGFKLTAFLSILITSVSILIGAAYSSRKGRRKGYLSGLMVAVIYMACILLYSKLNGNIILLDLNTIGRIILAVLIGILSGMLGINL
ncbi:MAG: TIGR04086 family membrane protein [Bacillota bacterium]|nr:TIGR04086 family membrane protein [Bacillota bacterium]